MDRAVALDESLLSNALPSPLCEFAVAILYRVRVIAIHRRAGLVQDVARVRKTRARFHLGMNAEEWWLVTARLNRYERGPSRCVLLLNYCSQLCDRRRLK